MSWNKIREQVLERDNYICQTCLQPIDRLDVHHVIPKKKNGSNSLDNLTSVCRKCHGLIETAEPFRDPNTPTIKYKIVRIEESVYNEVIKDAKYGDSFNEILRKKLQQNAGGQK